MKSSIRISLVAMLVAYVCFEVTTPAHAYLDPGTGSLLLQGLIATLAAAAATGSIYWGKIRAFFSAKKNDSDNVESDDRGEENE